MTSGDVLQILDPGDKNTPFPRLSSVRWLLREGPAEIRDGFVFYFDMDCDDCNRILPAVCNQYRELSLRFGADIIIGAQHLGNPDNLSTDALYRTRVQDISERLYENDIPFPVFMHSFADSDNYGKINERLKIEHSPYGCVVHNGYVGPGLGSVRDMGAIEAVAERITQLQAP